MLLQVIFKINLGDIVHMFPRFTSGCCCLRRSLKFAVFKIFETFMLLLSFR